MNLAEKQEHEKRMKEAFPDWPCTKCIGCAKHARADPQSCTRWKNWFMSAWREVTERIRGEA